MNKGSMVPFEDDGYDRFMKNEGRKWIEENVGKFRFESHDGGRLQAFCAVPDNPRAAVVMVHGFCEFFGKYHELFYDFLHEGYAVFFYEQRGFGRSLREVDDKDAVYVRDFADYVRDLDVFVAEVRRRIGSGLDLMLFAHSMGGCVGALYLEEHPETFTRAVLSSPMLKMALRGRTGVRAVCGVQKVLGRLGHLAVGQRRFDGRPDFEHSCALSPARYSYQFNQRLKDAEYQTNGATYAWVGAALKAERKLMRDADRVRVPVLICSAGRDDMVDVSGQHEFAAKNALVRIEDFPDAKHEIFNASGEILARYYHVLFEFYGE